MAQLNFSDIENVIHQMHCDLRNKEGITGMNAMHHINLVLLMRALSKEKCKKIGLDSKYSFEELKDLSAKDLFKKVYNQENRENCWLFNIWKINELGFNKDIPFEIKKEITLHSLFCRAKTIDTKYMFNKTDIIGDIYESFIKREGKTMKDLGQYFTDRDLIDYLVRLTEPKVIDGHIESIYDGASGTGGFLTQSIGYLNKNFKDIDWRTNSHNIYGIDINRNTFALLKLNMFYTIGEIMPNLSMNDSLTTESTKVGGYDVILMNPPFGIKGLKYTDMNSNISNLKINGTKGEILFLQNCMVNLADGGRCCIVVPDGVLFNSTKMYKETRKYLLENFELEKVIKVGVGEFFKNTGVKTDVLFFKKSGESTKNVKFVQVNKVGNVIEEVPLMDVSIDKIKENDYSLNMNLYKDVDLNINKEFDNFKISELFKFKGGKLSATKSSNTGEYEVISVSNKRTHNNFTNEGKTLAICGHGGGTPKIQFTENKCILSTLMYDIVPINEDIINKKYFFYYFKFINEEIKKNCLKGACQPSLNFDVFNKLKIPLPHIEVQERIVEQLDNIYANEIENSKQTIEGLEKSIENIMKNTLQIKNLKEYKMNSIITIKRGNLVSQSDNKDENIYPYYAGSSISGMAPTYEFENESIMMNYRLSTGAKKPCIYIGGGQYNCSRFSWVLKNKNDINFKYLYFYLNSNVNYDDLLVGSTILEINSTTFKAYKVYLPPIEIQDNIVEELNSKETLINLLKDNITQSEKQANDNMSQLFH
jgi:type I restriction enzyme M protein